MARQNRNRVRGIALLASGIVGSALLAYVVLEPGGLQGIDPTLLIVLLAATIVIAFWQAYVNLQ